MNLHFKKVYFEIGNTCNLQCSFCPEVKREKARVSLEQAKEVLKRIAPHTERVCYHLMGEPTLHPEFLELVRLANEMKVALEITTNGTLVESSAQALLETSVHQVNFSLQSFSDNFPSANPQVYFQKILDFCELAQKLRPDLYINFRLWNQPKNATTDSGNEVYLQALEKHFQLSINRNIDPKLTKSKNLLGRIYLHFDTRFDWPSLDSPNYGETGTCWGTRSQVGIHSDGTVVPCCLDKEAKIPLGNIFETELQEIVKSEKYQRIKTGFENGRKVEELCQKCEFSCRFSKTKNSPTDLTSSMNYMPV